MITLSTGRYQDQTCEDLQAFPWQGTLQTHTAGMRLNEYGDGGGGVSL